MMARRHHYVPRCYLKGFVKDRKKGSILTDALSADLSPRDGGHSDISLCKPYIEDPIAAPRISIEAPLPTKLDRTKELAYLT
jgi:hypothetical protein